jgi:hypothetical protein
VGRTNDGVGRVAAFQRVSAIRDPGFLIDLEELGTDDHAERVESV